MNEEYENKQCGSCRHFHRQKQVGVIDLSQVLGDCRRFPPSATVLPVHGGTGQFVQYGQLPPEFPACAEHVQRVEVAT